MKKYFMVSFQYSESIYCTNIAHAKDSETAYEHYAKKYPWVIVNDCTDGELEEARRKGMPIVEV